MNIISQYIKAITVACCVVTTFPAFANTPIDTLEFVTLSDIHLNVNLHEPMIINSSEVIKMSNLDPQTFKTFLTDPNIGIPHVISANYPQTKFVVVLGDTVGYNRVDSLRVKDLQYALKDLKEDINLPILNAMGNNDSFIKDYGLFTPQDTDIAKKAGWGSYFLSTGAVCSGSFPCIAEEKSSDGEGYFAGYLTTGLKYIGLNSVMFEQSKGTPEPTLGKELDWLDAQLKDSAQKQDSVLMGMHVPPGTEWTSAQFDKFGGILKKYPHVVIGIFAGHEHTETIRALAFELPSVVNGSKYDLIPLIHNAALSTESANAPSFKHYTLSKKDAQSPWAIKDFDTYSYQQKATSDPISVMKLYSFNEAYCPGKADLTVVDCMAENIPNFRKPRGKINFNASFKSKAKEYYHAGNSNYTAPSADRANIIFIK